jgi:hypothetical protein
MLRLRLAARHADETFSVQVNSTDRDGDGHDDVLVKFTLSTLDPAHEASALFGWLDRSAGLSRDLPETERSFADIGSVSVVRAQGNNTSKSVAQRVANARRLFGALCAEGGSFKLTVGDGEALPCGNLQAARDFYAQAEVTAALAQSDPYEALAAFRRADWFGGALSLRTRSKLEKAILDTVPQKQVQVTELDIKVRTSSANLGLSPLSFVDNESLLIQTEEGIQRFALAGESAGQLSDVSDEFDRWPLAVQGPAGETLLSLTFPCEAPTLALQGSGPGGNLLTVGTTDWLSPRPGLCRAGNRFDAPSVAPVRWTTEGLSALLDGVWVGPAQTVGLRGSALSPNGDHRVTTTPLGLLVGGRERAEFWKLDAGIRTVSHCVINNSGSRVACVDGGKRVLWLTEPSEHAAPGEASGAPQPGAPPSGTTISAP